MILLAKAIDIVFGLKRQKQKVKVECKERKKKERLLCRKYYTNQKYIKLDKMYKLKSM